MAEVGLVKFATVAMEITQAAIPRYRTKFSKHIFTQPQLLTILCLMRYEDWTFREAEVRLAEHSELRKALGLRTVPDYTTLYRFMRRVTEATVEQCLEAIAAQVAPPGTQKTTLAVDATGLAPGAISTFFVKRARDDGEGFSWRHWLKWIIAVDVPRRLILAQSARQGPSNDCATLRPLVDKANQRLPVGLVLADGEFDSERNHQFIRTVLTADSIIPAKRGKADWHITGIRAQMRHQFPRRLYGQRSIVESVISSVKRKLSSRAPGRSIETQCLQALVLGLAYDVYRL